MKKNISLLYFTFITLSTFLIINDRMSEIYETIFELYMSVIDVFGVELHAARYIYYSIASDHEQLPLLDLGLLFGLLIPIAFASSQYLFTPPI